ncbi:BlaI/MecI/CopY family transcriptional regulator [Nocardioides sp. TRM66260-LWL]|uniref:BlaI/MecI/CopY family transcriptional regulator n=1 Tax=Nocardioides sp. TRM66260-LWL TaxID=2874478 RepID=UPI001CC50793|nr:BlaI/MecI/CopY family transcriptional regulator [Nocardioides sp. TRM66260-LWL]MBZ5733524.1 BlaI/MecI/CopY family transcriptional regulator [Nocardioides sp. TRM66260-LWL]
MKGLGELEAQVMEILWSAESALAVRQVLDALPQDRNRAYTTVMTVLDNLHRKDFVHRERVGRAWHYRPATSRDAHVAGLMSEALDTGGDRTAALVHFVEQLPPEEAAELRALLDRSRE